jgi:pyruvate kinase
MPGSFSAVSWDSHVLAELIDELGAIRTGCVEMEQAFAADLRDQHPSYRDSARNLLHYIALRRRDIREVQKRLASLGLSSLGRTESHVLDNLTAVSRILHHLVGRPWNEPGASTDGVDFAAGKTLLHQHTAALLGSKPPKRAGRARPRRHPPPDAGASEQEALHAPAAAGLSDASVV